MKNNKIIRTLGCLVLSASLLLTGCTKLSQADMPTGERFDTYVDELFLEEITENTINLHYTLAYPENYGITDYEVSLGDYTVKDIEESYKELKEMRDELLSFDVSELSEEQRLTYDVLMDYVDTELMSEDFVFYSELLSPLAGYQAQLPVILAEYTFRTEQDIKDYLALVGQVDEMFAQIMEFEREKSEAGLFMPEYAAETVIDQCEQFIEDPENNYMIEIFNDKIDAFEGLSDDEKDAYKEQNRTLITTDVVDGYKTLIEGLSDLKETGTNENGLCYYEDGKEYYEYLVRTATGSDDSVEELQKRTEDFMSECINNISRIMMKNPEILDLFYEYSFPITEPDAILQDLIGKISEDFPETSATNYTVKYVHPSMEDHMSPAFYLTTPVDDVEHNVIYINRKQADEGMMDLYPTLAHEGYPGHLYQNSYTNSCNLPLIRHLISYSGYTEGWATYTEFYSYGISGLDEDFAEVLWQNQAYTLAMYACMDMGIHYDGWDRDDTAKYLASFGIYDSSIVDEVFETLVEEPANYLSYFIGYLEFANLREIAEEELGEDFEAKEFHRFLLETGPASFYVIEDHMQDWMETQKN